MSDTEIIRLREELSNLDSTARELLDNARAQLREAEIAKKNCESQLHVQTQTTKAWQRRADHAGCVIDGLRRWIDEQRGPKSADGDWEPQSWALAIREQDTLRRTHDRLMELIAFFAAGWALKGFHEQGLEMWCDVCGARETATPERNWLQHREDCSTIVRKPITMDAQKELPRYQCHKIVHALKIQSVLSDGSDNSHDGRALITPAEYPYAPFEVERAWIEKHAPVAGGYYVVYKDGYTSFSPAKAFEDSYTRIEP